MAVTNTESLKPTTVNGVAPQKEEVAAPAAPKPVENDLVEIELQYELVNNGQQITKYGPGKVKVSRDLADDLMRRNAAALKADHDRLHGTDRSSGNIADLR